MLFRGASPILFVSRQNQSRQGNQCPFITGSGHPNLLSVWAMNRVILLCSGNVQWLRSREGLGSWVRFPALNVTSPCRPPGYTRSVRWALGRGVTPSTHCVLQKNYLPYYLLTVTVRIKSSIVLWCRYLPTYTLHREVLTLPRYTVCT